MKNGIHAEENAIYAETGTTVYTIVYDNSVLHNDSTTCWKAYSLHLHSTAIFYNDVILHVNS